MQNHTATAADSAENAIQKTRKGGKERVSESPVIPGVPDEEKTGELKETAAGKEQSASRARLPDRTPDLPVIRIPRGVKEKKKSRNPEKRSRGGKTGGFCERQAEAGWKVCRNLRCGKPAGAEEQRSAEEKRCGCRAENDDSAAGGGRFRRLENSRAQRRIRRVRKRDMPEAEEGRCCTVPVRNCLRSGPL